MTGKADLRRCAANMQAGAQATEKTALTATKIIEPCNVQSQPGGNQSKKLEWLR